MAPECEAVKGKLGNVSILQLFDNLASYAHERGGRCSLGR